MQAQAHAMETRTRKNESPATAEARQRTPQSEAALAPPVDVFENDHEILIVADLPGVDASAIDVTLDGSELVLEGRREGSAAARYRRTFHVPSTVDPDRLAAKMDAGVLTLRLGKRDEVKPRRIEVQSAG